MSDVALAAGKLPPPLLARLLRWRGAADHRVLAPTAAICRHYGIDPLGLIGSGALLVTVAASRTSNLLRAWARQGIAGHVIGSVGTGRGVRAIRGGRPARFPWLARDEIITALGHPACSVGRRTRDRGRARRS